MFEALSGVMALSGHVIIRAIVAGERDAKVLACLRYSRVKASEQDIARARTGNWRDEYWFVLGGGKVLSDVKMPTKTAPLRVVNARHSPRYDCVLCLKRGCFDPLWGHAQCPFTL